MADNTRNDDDSERSERKRASRKTGERKPRAQAKRNGGANERRAESAPKRERTQRKERQPQRRRQSERRDEGFRLEGRNKNIALGTAAVLTAGIAGALYAAWRHHADELSQMARGMFADDDEDALAEDSANMEGAAMATGGTTPRTRRPRAARDVPPEGDERDAFAPATVPVAETMRTDSPATA